MLKLLSLTWTVWKVASKRMGPVAGLATAVVVVGSYISLKRLLRGRNPPVDELEPQAP